MISRSTTAVPEPAKPRQKRTAAAFGCIRADEAYTRAEFGRRTGLGRHAVRALKKNGLPVASIAGREFILGADFLALVARMQSGNAARE